MVSEVGFERFGVLSEDAGLATIVPFLDGVESTGSEVDEAPLDRGEGESAELGDVLLGHSVSGESEDVHA